MNALPQIPANGQLRYSLPKPEESHEDEPRDDFGKDFSMGDRKSLKRTEWATYLGIISPILTVIWFVGHKDADIINLKEEFREARNAQVQQAQALHKLEVDVSRILGIMEQAAKKGN